MSRLAFWTQRSPQERRALMRVGGVVLALLIAAFAWLPLERAHARLTAEMPTLRASVAQMRVEAEEARRLRALAPRLAADPGKTVSDTTATLVASGVLAQGLPGARVVAVDARRVRVTLSDAAWNSLVTWIERVQSANGLAVESATVEALPIVGRVRAELILARP